MSRYSRLNFLDRRIPMAMPGSHSDDWQPLLTYRNSLVHGGDTDQAGPSVINKRVYSRKGKKNQEQELHDIHEEGEGDGEEDVDQD